MGAMLAPERRVGGMVLWSKVPDKRLTSKDCSHPHWPGRLGEAWAGRTGCLGQAMHPLCVRGGREHCLGLGSELGVSGEH